MPFTSKTVSICYGLYKIDCKVYQIDRPYAGKSTPLGVTASESVSRSITAR
jgi:hypothetical protein